MIEYFVGAPFLFNCPLLMLTVAKFADILLVNY